MTSPGYRPRHRIRSLTVGSTDFVRWMAPVVLMLTLLLQAGPVAAQDATPIAASPVPTSGDFDGLVDIGNGRRLYLTCRGSGSPTVLLEAGAGNNAQIWEQIALPADSDKEAVLPAVAQFTRVCAYDRPGTLLDEVNLSRSDPVTGRRTAEEMVADVHALIEAAGLELPLVLAGHSFGGLIDRLYTNTYPSDVAGLVFIDAAHEDYYEGLHELLTPEQWTAAQDLPLPVTESIDSLASGAQVHAAQETSPLPSIPAVVLAHGSKGFGFGEDYPGEALEQIWRSAQEKLAALVPGSKFIVATESGHYIQLDQPELVIDAIRDVVEAVRDPGSWATPVASPSAG